MIVPALLVCAASACLLASPATAQQDPRPAREPALAMGLAGVSDWSTQTPFIDIMKTARPWLGHVGSDWGAVRTDYLRAMGHLDTDGWPLSIPDGVDRLESVLLVDQHPDADHLRGDYVMLYDGQADITLTGRAQRVRQDPGRVSFSYEPGPGLVGIALDAIDESDPIRNIRVVRRDQLQLLEAGGLFNPDWLARVEDLRSVRFMDWMLTNNSTIARWEDRPRLSDATWGAWGVPVEVMVRLANRIGADPWFTMPHMADDDYVRNFAALVRDTLDPRLKAHVEYSNEVWNFIFEQAHWARAQADALWGRTGNGWVQFYGMRAAQVMDIWSDVFGDAADDRLVRVVVTQTGWLGLEEPILRGPLALVTLGRFPVESFDAYGVTGYFGYEMGGEEMADTVNGWLDDAEQAAADAGRAEGLSRVALREYVEQRRYQAAVAPMEEALREGSLRRLIDETWPYHKRIADAAGLRLVMYEGGTHLAARGAQMDDPRIVEYFTHFNYTPAMAGLYETLLTGWVDAGGTMFNAFQDVIQASRFGSWGAMQHLDDDNPRWDVLAAFNAAGPTDWEDRDPAAFANGVTRQAGDAGATLTGTPQDDVLAGGPGDDRLVSSGGRDRLGGGEGQDVAVLPGAPGDWRIVPDGDGLRAEGAAGIVHMRAIEAIVFSEAPDRRVPASSF